MEIVRLKKINVWDYVCLSFIPVFVSLSWVLGGSLVKTLSPLVLSSSRMIIGAVILLFFSDLWQMLRNMSYDERIKWLFWQLILAITGRVLYYYLSTKSMVTIQPVEAILITTLMPLLSLATESLLGQKSGGVRVWLMAFLSSVSISFAVLLSMEKDFRFSIELGHLLMVAAISFFVLHLSLYKRHSSAKSVANPLLIQFAVAGIILLPFDISGYGQLRLFSPSEWVQFSIYAIACNLLPFVFMHYALKKFSGLTVSAVSILTPVFGFSFQAIILGTLPSTNMIFFSLAGMTFVFLTLKFNQNSNLETK